ncbi:hypothetical protein FRB94_014322 [Tulasnella sp. JGI-2019a]|nr:hypothetical protein FRB94_014322 [Tulasnella sp. JGI-2019a]
MANETLSDGSTVTPIGKGYQFVSVQTVDPNYALYMDGTTDCSALTAADNALYADPTFIAVAQNNSGFLEGLKQYVGDRPTLFSDMIYDYMNVQYIHNATFRQVVEAPTMAQVRTLANWNQWASYSSPTMGDVRNIGGQTMLSEILELTNRFADSNDSLKFALYGGSYKPFISLFQLFNVTQYHPELEGIVNYAAAISLEIREFANATVPNEYYIRFNFKNGTDDADFKPYPMLGRPDGQYDVPLSEFRTALSPYAISQPMTWCTLCKNTEDRMCPDASLLAALLNEVEAIQGSGLFASSHKLSAAVGGVIGALIALVLASLLVLALIGMGIMGWNGRRGRNGDAGMRRKSSTGGVGGVVVRAVAAASGKSRHMKKDSGFAGDSESVRGIVKNPGVYEMMDDIQELRHIPSRAPSDLHSPI